MGVVNVTVLFFAKCRELTGKKASTVTIDERVSYENLLNTIVEYFSLEEVKNSIVLAVNEEYVTDGDYIQLKDNDEVAVIPPAKTLKEMDFIHLTEGKLDIKQIADCVKSPKCGAISLFIGTTRDNFNNLEVTKLVYEAYESMAVKSMKEICSQVRLKWPEIENIAIHHRTGEVGVTEESIVVAVSSPHRADSLAAVSYAIDELKAKVPIWKKEEYKNNIEESQWKRNKECNWSQE